MSKLNITYIYHSGFVVETENNILVFDYYKGTVPHKVLSGEKQVYVFVSHYHSDHFNADIFNWVEYNPNIKYVLSSDASKLSQFTQHISIEKGEQLKLDNLTVKAYGSTDEGISFMIYVDDVHLFHAGDLNWWHWKEDGDAENIRAEKWFKKEIENLKQEKIDIAFFPVDGRLEEYYYLGGEYFINKLSPKVFIPMHFGDNAELTKKFNEKIKIYNTNVITIDKEGYNIDV